MKKLVIFISIMFFLSCVSAVQTNSSNYQVDSVISGGGANASSTNYETDAVLGIIIGNTFSSSYKQYIGFFTGGCAPITCTILGYTCGNWSDGCSGTLTCGSCASGSTCTLGTCVVDTVTPPGGGGDDGDVTPDNFKIEPDLIKVLVKQGESEREIITITNLGTTILNVSLDLVDIEELIVMSEDFLSLKIGESKEINVDIFAREQEIPEIYTGKIIVKDERTGVTKTINVIIEVKAKKPLFDIRTDIIFKKVSLGKDVSARINVLNLGDLENIDVLIYYAIKDLDENIISFKEESMAIDKKLDIKRKIKLPQNILLGDYLFYSRVSYGDITASSMDTFEVVERTARDFLGAVVFILLLVIVIISMLIIVLVIRRKRKQEQGVVQ